MTVLSPQAPAQAVAISPAALQLLRDCGAMQTPHSGRTLFDHLRGTYGLLKEWGNPEPVCLAGLFHSIYGTNAFTRQSLPAQQRERLQEAIGRDAEELAWAFCGIDRPTAITQALQAGPSVGTSLPLAPRKDRHIQAEPIVVTPAQLAALAEIECANLIEQRFWRGALRDLYCACIEHPVVSPGAMKALRQGYAKALSVGARPEGVLP